jgi:hypothetical protein
MKNSALHFLREKKQSLCSASAFWKNRVHLRKKKKKASRRRRRRGRLRKRMAEGGEEARRRAAIAEYRKKLLTCRELEARVKTGNTPLPHPLPPVYPCVDVIVGLWGSVSWRLRAAIADGGIWILRYYGGGVGFWLPQFGFGVCGVFSAVQP